MEREQEIDWAGRWQRIVEARRRQVEALAGQGPQGEGFWNQRAVQFRRLSERLDAEHDPLVAMVRAALGTGTLLDVGAGTGRYSVPLAAQAARVTAVEPSSGMRQQLAERLQGAGLANVTLVPDAWEAAEVAVHDVVLCAHVLYPIADIVPFLRKLAAHARRAWFLTIRVDPLGAEVDPMWRPIWGIARPAEPTFLDLYPLVFSLGYHANVSIRTLPRDTGAESLEQALEAARGRLLLPADEHRHDALLRQFLEEQMVVEEGRWHWPIQREEAIIWCSGDGAARDSDGAIRTAGAAVVGLDQRQA